MKTASSDGLRRWPAIAALAALLLAAGAVAAIALTGGTGGRTSARSPSATRAARRSSARRARRARARSVDAAEADDAGPEHAEHEQHGAAPASGGGGDPKALNDQGFALIRRGNNAAAVPLLQQSVQGFRDQGRTGEIDYAFALFNLATALRATGHPDQAIPLLEERLQRSDYKRAEVSRELAAARQQAGQPPAKAKKGKKDNSGPGKGGGDGGGRGPGPGATTSVRLRPGGGRRS